MQQLSRDGAGEARLRANLAGLLLRRGEAEAAAGEARRAIALAPPETAPAACAAAHRQLGRALFRLRKPAEACSALASAAELFARARLPGEEAATRLELGQALLERRDARSAINEFSRALRGKDAVAALHLLAESYDALQQPHNALAFRERAIEAVRASGDVELRRALLDDGIAAAERLDRGDLVRAWRIERADLDGRR